MLRLFLIVVISGCVDGKLTLPPLPMKDGCYQVTAEVEVFRMEGEAVILSFPIFQRVLTVRNLAPPTATYLITKGNGTAGGVADSGEGRVRQCDKQLRLLPAHASDSGEYVCTYRNESYCVSGRISLQVFESGSVDVHRAFYPISASVGQSLTYRCPSLSHFNRTDTLIQWFKENSSTVFQSGRVGSSPRDSGNLVIATVRRSHAGLYTCQLRVLVDQQPYKVSRVVLLQVHGSDPETTPTVPDISVTSDPKLSSSSSYTTVHALPPVIISPLNGSIVESPHGSGVELFCTVLTDCRLADSTLVTWLVNGQSVESSYLDGRALQGGRRVTMGTEGCQIELRLIVVAMTEEDVSTELKCVARNRAGREEVVAQLHLEDSTFTWLMVAAVASSCFLSVVSIFLYVLFKHRKKNKLDYILARHNSSF